MVKHILVLGGSSFMGKTFLEMISKISQEQNYDIHYINRNKKYWNNEVKNIKNINYTYGDRNHGRDFTKLLKYLSNKLNINTQNKWHCIIDFCAYEPKNVFNVYQGLKNLVNLYIFISTNSVYDVCDTIDVKQRNIKEDEAIRPSSLEKQKKLNKNEDYGHQKLMCEELLLNIQKKEENCLPYLVLRLPDVIGPYDDTHRYWVYYKWIREISNINLSVDYDGRHQKMSLVYSKDVAQILIDICAKIQNNSFYQKILDKCFNIGFEQDVTLEELLQKMIDSSKLNRRVLYEQDSKQFLSSVECGPSDNSLAIDILEFKPTSLDQAIYETDQFFSKAHIYYPIETAQVEAKIHKKLKKQ